MHALWTSRIIFWYYFCCKKLYLIMKLIWDIESYFINYWLIFPSQCSPYVYIWMFWQSTESNFGVMLPTVIDGGFGTQMAVYVGPSVNSDPLWSARSLISNPQLTTQIHVDFLKGTLIENCALWTPPLCKSFKFVFKLVPRSSEPTPTKPRSVDSWSIWEQLKSRASH